MPDDAVAPVLTDLERGLIAGLLLAEGSFGGDGRQPQLTLKLHVRHEALLRWLVERLPRTRLYGPYEHGDRHYFQWMARGRALVLDVLPIVEAAGIEAIDAHAAERIGRMRERYAESIARFERLREPPTADAPRGSGAKTPGTTARDGGGA